MADKLPVPIESEGVQYRLKGSRGQGTRVKGKANLIGVAGRAARRTDAAWNNLGDDDEPGAAYAAANMLSGMDDTSPNSPYKLRR